MRFIKEKIRFLIDYFNLKSIKYRKRKRFILKYILYLLLYKLL